MLTGYASLPCLLHQLRRPPARWCGRSPATDSPGACGAVHAGSPIGSLVEARSFLLGRSPSDFGGTSRQMMDEVVSPQLVRSRGFLPRPLRPLPLAGKEKRRVAPRRRRAGAGQPDQPAQGSPLSSVARSFSGAGFDSTSTPSPSGGVRGTLATAPKRRKALRVRKYAAPAYNAIPPT